MPKAPQLLVREAVADDVQALHELYTLHLAENPPAYSKGIACWSQLLQQFISDPNYYILVGESAGRVVSSVTLIIIPNLTYDLSPYALIENVVTHADYRKQGYAGQVMQMASTIAQERGCYKIMLMTGSRLESTLNFYEQCGFSRTEKTAFLKRL